MSMTMQSSNQFLQVNVTDNKLTGDESSIYTRLTNSKYFILSNSNLYDCDGLLFESPSVTKDTELNTVTITYDKFTVLLNDTAYLIEDDTLDVSKLAVLYTIYSSIVATNSLINVTDYSYDPTTEMLTMSATMDTYSMSYDLPKFITDRISAFVAAGTADKPTAMQEIIDAEISTVYNLKSSLDLQSQKIFTLYIDIAKYKSQ